MITLKLGFIGISLGVAFWATTPFEPRLDHEQPQTQQLNSLDDPNHIAPHCLSSSCDIGALMSNAFMN